MQKQQLQCINGERLWQSLMDMAQIGATEKGGSCRAWHSPMRTKPAGIFLSPGVGPPDVRSKSTGWAIYLPGGTETAQTWPPC